MNHYAVWIALAAGAVLPIQALINGRLSAGLGSPLWGALISFQIAVVVLGLAILITSRSPSNPLNLPIWVWTGGVLGSIYVTGAIVSVGTLGPATATCLIIAGQIIVALMADSFGIVGPKNINFHRIGGAALVMTGAVIVLRT